ncbi:hypothetical protein K1T35_30770 [Pseudonocardia sp. DSM 110487]|jgi:hypothetical protein|uniref:hypothetical protein n=1 Tax=Pseudonocardia sp. DSM 110487 TaxID=2865833 RepID=UPI001C696344|nr:hypothetical protein [Pseudonocardia sp. DSM 110487]QYN32919.1 hypothetical protein K1T35_30770 [Pseudonocardia sp. DSM 110487]
MPDPLLSSLLATVDNTQGEPNPADAAPAPANRAARRGRAGKNAPSGAVHAGSSGHARAAQGRRINPVRRTG